jgi:hypothetical protein
MRKSSSIRVGSTELERYALKYNSNVFMQTSPIIEHEHQKEKRNSILNVGWVGDLGNGNKLQNLFHIKRVCFQFSF